MKLRLFEEQMRVYEGVHYFWGGYSLRWMKAYKKWVLLLGVCGAEVEVDIVQVRKIFSQPHKPSEVQVYQRKKQQLDVFNYGARIFPLPEVV